MHKFPMNEQDNPSAIKQALHSSIVSSRPQPRKISLARIIAAMLGLSVPIMVGAAAGCLQSGVTASLGGLIVGTQSMDGTAKDKISALAYALVAGGLAMFVGTTVSGNDFSGWIIVAMCAVAAFGGGISRTLALSTTQFMILLIIAGNMPVPQPYPLGMTILFALGFLWASALLFGLESLFRAIHRSAIPDTSATPPSPPPHTLHQLFRYWRFHLKHWRGWQYTLRIILCLGAAEILRQLWPHNHSYWISLTVAIVVHRDLQSALTRTFQRTLGTFLGVLFASLLLLGLPPVWVMIGLIALLAGARTILIDINYTAYVAAVTPLIILLLDFGRPLSALLMTHRLIATLAGCLIAFSIGYLVWTIIPGRLQNTSGEKK